MKRLNVNIPQEIIDKLDEIAKERFMNRTELIKQILLDYIKINNKWNF